MIHRAPAACRAMQLERPPGSMHFDLTLDYPTSLDRLWAVLARPDYLERKYEALDSRRLEVLKADATANRIAVELRRAAPVERARLPRWARAFVGDTQAMRQRSRWRRVEASRVEAEIDVTPEGLPVSAHGQGSIVELSPQLTRATLRFTVRCSLPLVGARVERVFARHVQEALHADHEYALRHLAAGPPP